MSLVDQIRSLLPLCAESDKDLNQALSRKGACRSLMSLTDREHSEVVEFVLIRKESAGKEFFSKQHVKAAIASLAVRLKTPDSSFSSAVLSKVNFVTLKAIEKLAPLTVRGVLFANLSADNSLPNEIQCLNSNPVFLKNRFLQLLRCNNVEALARIAATISNVDTYRLIARELKTGDYFKIFQLVQVPILHSFLKRGKDVLSGSNQNDVINGVIAPQLLANPMMESVDEFIAQSTRSVLRFVPSAVVQLMGTPSFPQKLIPLASALCAYRNMSFITLIQDETTALFTAIHIVTNYTFRIDALFDSLLSSGRFSKFIQRFGSYLNGCDYFLSKTALKSCFANSSDVQEWVDFVKFDDRIAADMASVLIKHIPYSEKVLHKLAESGLISFQTIGAALFVDPSLWEHFCLHFSGKEEFVKMCLVLCLNILNTNQLELALRAISIASEILFDSFPTEKSTIYSKVCDCMLRVMSDDTVISAFMDAFISSHPLSFHLKPLKQIIHNISLMNWEQICVLIYSENKNPSMLVLKVKLYNYRMMNNPQLAVLHR